jgi:phosphate uptake regulator
MVDDEREQRAKRLLDDPLFVEAFDTLEKELLLNWSRTSSSDVSQRESCWLATRLLERIKAHITSIVETGHMAKVMEKQHPHL